MRGAPYPSSFRRNVSQAAGHRAERLPPRADPLWGDPGFLRKEAGAGDREERGRQAEVSVKPGGRHGGLPHSDSCALRFGDLGSCYLGDKAHLALEISPSLSISVANNQMQVLYLLCCKLDSLV